MGSAIVVAGFVSGCVAGCYTGPINMRPTVSMDPPADPIFRGQSLTFTATVSDPNGDAINLSWATTDGACPQGFVDSSLWPPESAFTPGFGTFTDDDDTRTTFCVWVKAVDQYGAASVDAHTCNRVDRAPIAVIVREAPVVTTDPSVETTFPLHTAFKLSADQSTDPDPGDTAALTFTWALVSAPDPQPDTSQCATGALCTFTASVSGLYEVQLTASDGTDMSVVFETLRVLPGPAPEAVVERILPTGPGPYPLGTMFKVSGASSTGGDANDPLEPHWILNLDGAPGSTTALHACPDDPSLDVQCFIADAAGTYVVQLSVTSDTTSPIVTLLPALEVLPDQPPCLGMTMPLLTTPVIPANADLDFNFKVGVSDDLDPLPAVPVPLGFSAQAGLFGLAHVQWFLYDDSSGAFTPENNSATFKIDAGEFQVGEQARVRVQISDADTDRSLKEFAACTTDTCFTGNASDGCFQRMTWTVSFNQ